jgi:acetolactate decarboxylase
MMRACAMVSVGIATACSCSTQPVEAVKGGTPTGNPGGTSATEVHVWGSLRSVMQEGKTEGTVALNSVVPGPHAFAVGALSELRAEITVLDDDLIVSFGEPEGKVRTPAELPNGEMATLLVRAIVPRWSQHTVDHSIEINRLDDEIETVAKSAGLDLAARIPVVVEAKAKSVDWHVLGGLPPAGQNAHDGPRSVGKISDAMVTLVGFYSRNDAGIFTHMGERSHFHVIPSGERMTGHVDAKALEPGAIIRLPDRR